MKENILGPRQWAFVVITGGAACALPFLQTDSLPTRTDTASTSSPQNAHEDARYTLANATAAGGPLAASQAVSDIAPPLPAARLPEWANVDRSPFDDLIGVTAAKPKAAPPQEQLPMQPLRPWIAGPADSASPVATHSSARSAPDATAVTGAIAKRERTAGEASPWNDEPTGFTPMEQLANNSFHSAPRGKTADIDETHQWPDQAVSAEEIAQVTGSRDRELASAVVAPPEGTASRSSALLAAPVLPPATSSQTFTVPVAAQRHLGHASVSPGSATLPPTFGASQRGYPIDDRSSDEAASRNSNLPPLPPTRKSHIIFQPSIRK